MKKYYVLLIIASMLLPLASCELDNYDMPDATLSGTIFDHEGNPLQVEQGGSSMRLRMDELSWSSGDTSIAVIPFYLNVKQDGSYMNTRLFPGEYRVTPWQGAFYPYREEGEIINISGGNNVLDFEVTPYLSLEWVTEPYLDDDGFINAEFRFARNAKDGETMPDVTHCQLFISTTQFVGNNNFDSQLVGGARRINNDAEGTTISFKTTRAVKYAGITYFVRVGARSDDAFKNHNYTDVKQVVVAGDFFDEED